MAHVTNPQAEEALDKEIKCLNAGFVRLVDYMGGDESIVQAARVSYGKGTKTVNEDRGLIRYLMRHMHTTPFEMVVMVRPTTWSVPKRLIASLREMIAVIAVGVLVPDSSGKLTTFKKSPSEIK